MKVWPLQLEEKGVLAPCKTMCASTYWQLWFQRTTSNIGAILWRMPGTNYKFIQMRVCGVGWVGGGGSQVVSRGLRDLTSRA